MGREGDLVAQMPLDLVGQAASGQGFSRPEAAVLDQEPVVDSAGGRAERLVVLARETPRKTAPPALARQSTPWVTRQMTWPVETDCPGSTERLETVPARGVVISFSIFIASTTQTTWPARDLVAFPPPRPRGPCPASA